MSDEPEINLDDVVKATRTKTKIKPLAKVDAKNFDASARAWIAAAGGKGFMLARKKHTTKDGFKLEATLVEWGAWRAWRAHKGLPLHFLDERIYYMVPTQWPFQFDSEADEATDRHRGGMFFDETIARFKAG